MPRPDCKTQCQRSERSGGRKGKDVPGVPNSCIEGECVCFFCGVLLYNCLIVPSCCLKIVTLHFSSILSTHRLSRSDVVKKDHLPM